MTPAPGGVHGVSYASGQVVCDPDDDGGGVVVVAGGGWDDDGGGGLHLSGQVTSAR